MSKPAFPIHPHFLDPHCTPQELDKGTGMTLRDYFAAAALQGLCVNNHENEFADTIAEQAYLYAEMMMEARKK